MKTELSMIGLPYTPLDPLWLSESPAFHSKDAEIVRASLKMLMYAWKASPPATLPSSFRLLSEITGMSELKLSENFAELSVGWELVDERLSHVKMAALCRRLGNKFGDAIQSAADASALAVQDVDGFELVSPEPLPSKNKGLRALPAAWVVTEELRKQFALVGINDADDQLFVEQQFRDWVKSKSVRRHDWDGTFRNFVANADHRNLPSRRRDVPIQSNGMGRAGRFGGGYGSVDRVVETTNHNRAVFDRVRQPGASGSGR